jgi:hypothetical protein
MKDGEILRLDRCPHCGIAHPHLGCRGSLETYDHANQNPRQWSYYVCRTCGGVVMTMAPHIEVTRASKVDPGPFPTVRSLRIEAGEITAMWPSPETVAVELPERARVCLAQAIECLHSPMPSIVAAAAAIDAMLKGKGLKEGSLYVRIEQAAEQHLITPEMKAWAHEVRLDANDQRHADEEAAMPTRDDARKCVEFAKALGQFLYVLPARVQRGRGK